MGVVFGMGEGVANSGSTATCYVELLVLATNGHHFNYRCLGPSFHADGIQISPRDVVIDDMVSDINACIVVPNRASFEYSYSISSIRTNRAPVFL